jgi:hypothetical protein
MIANLVRTASGFGAVALLCAVTTAITKFLTGRWSAG